MTFFKVIEANHRFKGLGVAIPVKFALEHRNMSSIEQQNWSTVFVTGMAL